MNKVIPIEQQPFMQPISEPLLEERGIQLWLRREDLIHSQISGNKWWKLSGNLASVIEQPLKPTIITFGGAYSNHIYSTAAACNELGLPAIGIIRGELKQPLNCTLSFAENMGMKLVYISRDEYRDKASVEARYKHQFENALFIPEGGTNEHAIRSVAEMPDEEMNRCDFICVPVGTGGTLAGIIGGAAPEPMVIGYSVLKGDFLADDVTGWLKKVWPGRDFERWHIETSYHHGGYAKITPELIGFIQRFYRQHGILLDPIYTGKMMFGIYDMIRLGRFDRGSSICAIHTGGLQGWSGITERYGIDPTSF